MKIKEIKINGFGNLQNKEIEFNNKLNIIYGQNESGKSTLLKFITGMFYGLNKNKNGKEISDYEKYIPWNNIDFSGKLKYELDNKESFEIFREFKKKNPIIFDKNSTDISKQFNIDKNKGSEFFYEQMGIQEDLFLSTLISMQQELKLDKNNQNILIQKITNLIGTGEDNISFKKSINKLEKKLLEEVGTARSQDRPINIITNEIEKIKKEKEELKQYKNKKYEIEEIKNAKEKELNKLENKIKIIKEIKSIKEKELLEREKIKINKDIISEYQNKINEIKKEKNKKKLNSKNILLIIVFILINILSFVFIENKIFNYLLLLLTPIYVTISVLSNKSKKINSKNKKEIEILEKNINFKNKEINENENKIKIEIENNKNNLINIYKNKIEIEELFNNENINNQYEIIQENINKIKLELHTLELDKNNILPKLENLSNLEEKLEQLEEQYNNIIYLRDSINLAKEYIVKVYEKMKNNITPKFTEELSNNMKFISNGKYRNIKLNDENELMIEIENGNYILAENLSVGTIEQIYLSLRLATLDKISKEKLPIIFDESFVYFDENRLENILQYLNNLDNQVLILSCTDREINLLNKLKIEYNLINLKSDI